MPCNACHNTSAFNEPFGILCRQYSSTAERVEGSGSRSVEDFGMIVGVTDDQVLGE